MTACTVQAGRTRIALVVVLLLTACRHAPATLSPQATTAWYGTRVIKDLDLLRDTAVDANAQQPPLISIDLTRRIVTYHESAIKIIHDHPLGWGATINTGLDELVRDLSFDPKAKQLIGPYVQLVKTILQEVPK